jgi:hypothetical protein
MPSYPPPSRPPPPPGPKGKYVLAPVLPAPRFTRAFLGEDATVLTDGHGESGGHFVVQANEAGYYGWNFADSPAGFALEVVGRGRAAGWAVDLTTDRKPATGVQVRLTARGEVVVEKGNFDKIPLGGPRVGPVAHPAIRPAAGYNRLLLVYRDRTLEVYVNGVAVLDPVRLDRDVAPGIVTLTSFHAGGVPGVAEIARVSVWPAADVPKFPDRPTANTLPPAARGPDPLFNGKDFVAWERAPSGWRWDGGGIAGVPPPLKPDPTCLWTKKPYRDFDLKFQARLKDAQGLANLVVRGRVADRSRFTLAGPRVNLGGPQAGAVVGDRPAGDLLLFNPDAVRTAALRPGGFTDVWVRCVGKRLTLHLNGVKVADEDVPALPDAGVIGFECLGGSSAPKDLRLRTFEFTELGVK